jgi:translation initiation factor 3 subunit A
MLLSRLTFASNLNFFLEKDIDKYDTSKLVRLQVEQLDKEKRDLSERLRVLHKRIDHLERAYRKEEAPLLAEDYERQQKEDRITHGKNVKAMLAAAKQKHSDDLDAKKRLARMTPDYQARRKEIAGKREEEFQSRRAESQRLMETEKQARKQKVFAHRLAEKEERDAEERQRRELEEEQRRREEGTH